MELKLASSKLYLAKIKEKVWISVLDIFLSTGLSFFRTTFSLSFYHSFRLCKNDPLQKEPLLECSFPQKVPRKKTF